MVCLTPVGFGGTANEFGTPSEVTRCGKGESE